MEPDRGQSLYWTMNVAEISFHSYPFVWAGEKSGLGVNSKTILVVEDEILIRMLMADELRAEGYQVAEAASGDEALSIMASGQRVDLIVTDVRMPGQTDGIKLTTYSKRDDPHRPVVLVSANLAPDTPHDADRFLEKPYTPATLLTVIDTLIGPPCQNHPGNRNAS